MCVPQQCLLAISFYAEEQMTAAVEVSILSLAILLTDRSFGMLSVHLNDLQLGGRLHFEILRKAWSFKCKVRAQSLGVFPIPWTSLVKTYKQGWFFSVRAVLVLYAHYECLVKFITIYGGNVIMAQWKWTSSGRELVRVCRVNVVAVTGWTSYSSIHPQLHVGVKERKKQKNGIIKRSKFSLSPNVHAACLVCGFFFSQTSP